jgi:CzcA family heavy metal efflux pump
MNSQLFRQANFIVEAVRNVAMALRDGAILVAIVLFAFLVNVRTTTITLVAIPLSIVITTLVFELLGLSINTMTLGGLAVAIGELVDDAIVDVENVLRRLRENAASESPRNSLVVVFEASREVRNSIVFGTAVVMLVFLPLFALESIEGRMFIPLAIAYITSILGSLVVSLTVTPALASYLLPSTARHVERGDGLVLRACKGLARAGYALTLPRPAIVVGVFVFAFAVAMWLVSGLGRDFLPPFNEGTATISVAARPSISLEESNRLGTAAENLLLEIPEIKSTGRRTGRAEQDEHAEGVHMSEVDVDFWTAKEVAGGTAAATPTGRAPPASLRPRELVLADVRARLAELPHAQVNVGQPISHRLDHLLSGVRAQVAIKVTGPELLELRRIGREIEAAIEGVAGVVDLQLEPQVMVPTLQLTVERGRAAKYGFSPGELADVFATAMQGKVISPVFEERGRYDLVLWSLPSERRDPDAVRSMRLVSRTGAEVSLADVADVEILPGPNQVNRENGERRFVVALNVAGRDLGSAVDEIRARIDSDVRPHLGAAYRIEFGGQFESEARASRRLAVLGLISLLGMFALLYAHFRSVPLVLQILLNVPFAFVGSAIALWVTGETVTVASLVGFISLTGIAARNGILMIAHYMHLMVHEKMPFGRELVVRGSQERVAPVAMTALTSALALLPLALAHGEPGKEILHPVALVVLGGLVSSTLLDFLVTPTVFLNWSGKAAARAVADRLEATQMDEVSK